MKLTFKILLLLSSINITAQTIITGEILDKTTDAPLEFAEVVLRPQDSSALKGGITNSLGRFSINISPGNYELEVIYVGQSLYSESLQVENEDLDVGTIKTDNSRALDEVLVVGRKKLIQQKIDRLIFNVGNSSKSSQGDAIEVLKITPGVRVENNDLSMIGKGELQVMVDGRFIRLSGLDLINFLNTIPSENIDRIEVINNPPAKYEASGNSGLINIVLKDVKTNSWNAMLKGTYLQRVQPTWRSTGIFNIKKDRFSFSSRFAYNHQFINIDNQVKSNFPDENWLVNNPLQIETEGYVATADIGYQISENWEVGGQYYYNGTFVKIDVDQFAEITDRESGEKIRNIRSQGDEPQYPKRHLVNFYNKVELASSGKKLILNLDYFKDSNPYNAKNYEGVSIDQESEVTQFFKSSNRYSREVTNYSATLDVEYPLEWIDLDFGGKFSDLQSDNDISFFNSGFIDEPVFDTQFEKTEFDYRENINSLYISASRNFGDNWSTQFGLRLEDTDVNASSEDSDITRNNDYTNVFPTFYLSYEATQNSVFSLNYSRRIERPSFFDLNPNLYFQNPFQAYSGNPYLQPAYIDNIELSNIYKDLVTKIYFSYENNVFGEVPLPDINTNTTLYTVENYINRSRIGLSENYTLNALDWWTSNLSLNVNYSKSTFNLELADNQEGFNSYLSASNDFELNAKKTILGGINYWYSFPGVDGIFKTKAQSSLDVSLQFLLLDKDMNITLRGSDLFRNALQQRTTNINGVRQELNSYFDTRQFWLILTYKFGNQNIKTKENKGGNEEERNRL